MLYFALVQFVLGNVAGYSSFFMSFPVCMCFLCFYVTNTTLRPFLSNIIGKLEGSLRTTHHKARNKHKTPHMMGASKR